MKNCFEGAINVTSLQKLVLNA